MKLVKVSELEDGDIFIDEGRYYKVLDPTHVKMSGRGKYIRVECFMAHTADRIGDIDIGDVIYIPTHREVLLCKREEL